MKNRKLKLKDHKHEKELEFYRTVEQLKENFINKYGFAFKNVISQIDKHNKGTI